MPQRIASIGNLTGVPAVGDLLKHIVEHNLHRVWVIGDDEKPK